MVKLFFILNGFLLVNNIYAQQVIAVHFLYGSKPAKGYENSETKWFGGKKGGHVTIETGDSIIGFQPGGKCHLTGKKKKCQWLF